jgi:restriction endonuclease Mrr
VVRRQFVASRATSRFESPMRPPNYVDRYRLGQWPRHRVRRGSGGTGRRELRASATTALAAIRLETLALRLLAAMGYGGRESVLEHTGQSEDAGLDGLVRQDALGLDLIGVQAKRYDPDNPLQRPALQGFVGALQGAQTNRGVFVTTGRFTQGARQFAESVAMQLVLIDGAELTRLMVEYNIGVSVRETFELKVIDEVSFEE